MAFLFLPGEGGTSRGNGLKRNVLARFSDVCGMQFSNFHANKERIERYFADAAKAA